MLILEFLVLFIAAPLIVRYLPWRVPPLPILWLATWYCLHTLKADPTFDRHLLWNAAAIPPQLPGMLATLTLGAVLIGLGTWRYRPKLLFGLVRHKPGLWLLLMILYPLLSVWPQGIVYRAFLIHRYTPLFGSGWLILAVSAAAFGFMHLVFRNPLAIGLTALGGAIFAWRYQVSGSLAASSLEHALYGCFLFTIGLGQYFYHRTGWMPQMKADSQS